MVGSAIAFLVVMFFVASPLLIRYVRFVERSKAGQSKEELPSYAIASVYVLILGAAAMTEWIGIHAIFGAFLLGVWN